LVSAVSVAFGFVEKLSEEVLKLLAVRIEYPDP
jgi:hypothetical protein